MRCALLLSLFLPLMTTPVRSLPAQTAEIHFQGSDVFVLIQRFTTGDPSNPEFTFRAGSTDADRDPVWISRCQLPEGSLQRALAKVQKRNDAVARQIPPLFEEMKTSPTVIRVLMSQPFVDAYPFFREWIGESEWLANCKYAAGVHSHATQPF